LATISSGLCFFWGIPSSSKWLENHTSGRTPFQGKGQQLKRFEVDEFYDGCKPNWPLFYNEIKGNWRWCQTYANQSLFAQTRLALGRTELTPLAESGGAAGLEVVSA
jgi:hypothetical protein